MGPYGRADSHGRIAARRLIIGCFLIVLVATSSAKPAVAADADTDPGPAISAQAVMYGGQQSLPEEKVVSLARRIEMQNLQIQQLSKQLKEMPRMIESKLTSHLSEVLMEQVRSWLIDPTQAAVLNATLTGRNNPMGARMVHFKGKDLLVVAPKNDEYVGLSILATGKAWQPHVLGPLMDLIRPGSTVVDAGANLGAYSIFFAAQTGPKGRVYSFEPQRKMFQALCTNAMVNGLLNIYPQHAALSFQPGEVHMSASVADGQSRGLNLTEAEEQGREINYGGMNLGKGGEKVMARTLDWYNLTAVSLIKVDVQGAEKLVFYGARETIRRNLPVVVYESTDFTISADMNATMHIPPEVHAFHITAFLTTLGYKPLPGEPISKEDVLMLPPHHPLLSEPGLPIKGKAGAKQT